MQNDHPDIAGAAHYVSGKYVSHLECLSNCGDNVVAVLGHIIFPNILKGIWGYTRGSGIRYEYCKDLVEYSNWGHTRVSVWSSSPILPICSFSAVTGANLPFYRLKMLLSLSRHRIRDGGADIRKIDNPMLTRSQGVKTPG